MDAILDQAEFGPELIKTDANHAEGAKREVLAGATQDGDPPPPSILEMRSGGELVTETNARDVLAWCEDAGTHGRFGSVRAAHGNLLCRHRTHHPIPTGTVTAMMVRQTSAETRNGTGRPASTTSVSQASLAIVDP